MPTPLITNFTINTNAPIDSRLVVTASSDRDALAYKYDGMQVFTLDSRSMWTYNSTTLSWTSSVSLDGNGIYSGNGNLPGNVYINTGTVINIVSSKSFNFVLGASASNNSIYYSTIFNRHTVTGDYTGVEVKTQYSYNSNTSSVAYISYNPFDPINGYNGGIDFATLNTRRVTINKNGILRLWNPTYSMDFNNTNLSSNIILNTPISSGTIALTSDITNLGATISLQYVTNNGNITNRPVSLQSSLGVAATFSIGSNFIFNNTGQTYNVDGVSYVANSSAAIFRFNSSSTSGSTVIKNVFIPNGCVATIEVTFNSTGYNSAHLTTIFNCSNKLIATFISDSSGNLTQVGSTTTVFSNANGSYLSPGVLSASVNTITLSQSWSSLVFGSSINYANLRCFYTIFISGS